MDPASLASHGPIPELWSLPGRAPHLALVEESIVTEQSGGSLLRKRRKRRDPIANASEDEASKLVSTSCGGGGVNELNDCDTKRLKFNSDSKPDVEETSAACSKIDQNLQLSEPSKQDYIHVRARRGQATDSHSLAERARREKISERMKILQDLVPGCNKVIGKASVLDEIINYIQALQRQVEFLSMKLEAVNSRMTNAEAFPPKDFQFGAQTYDTASTLAFSPQATKDYRHGSATEWLHMQVGGAFERVT